MNILVTGATGLVGAEVIRQAIIDDDVQRVTALVRRPLSIQHAKLTTILHQDFLDYSGITDNLKNIDAFLWCLGISQSQVTKDKYHVITYDYALAAANALLQANPNVAFLFLSGAGADSTEKSRTLFARVKGKMENALSRLPFKRFVIARPAGIKPIHKNPNTSFFNKVMIPLFPLLERVAPSYVITSVDLAKALLELAKRGSEKAIMENTDLKRIVAAL